MEAYCLLALRQPAEVLNLLDTNELEVGSTEPLLASAYQMTGNTTQAPDRFTGNFFDCTDADRTRLSESAKCGGIPAKHCVFGYSCYFISSRTVHRGLTVKCVDFAGAWCSFSLFGLLYCYQDMTGGKSNEGNQSRSNSD